jgi:glycosidase
MMNLIRNYDVDGFRFDAPTYNFFANWAPWAKSRAFMSPLGCIPLFVDMRHDMKREKPDALLYTEPSGLLLRRSMDVNYNYDEQWLVSALMSGSGAERAVRNGRDFMTWIKDRDDFLPIGAQTAHHIDSHDTFWWPQWGKKWRREQFSITATKALAASFLALDGPYMMFTGGEEGIEEALGGLLNFRNDNKDLWEVKGQFDTQSDPTEQLIIVTRTLGNKQVVSIINTSTDKKAQLPASYSGLSSAVQNGVNKDELEPLGYVFASRKI